jgi:hypothetical protein
VFVARPQNRDQHFCSGAACQRERRRRWQREKRGSDPDYRENQARAQRRWAQANRGYWRAYRKAHPEYAARNRAQQRERDRRRGAERGRAVEGEDASGGLAKSDASGAISLVPSGTYQLIPVSLAGVRLAKMDAWMVQIRTLSMS